MVTSTGSGQQEQGGTANKVDTTAQQFALPNLPVGSIISALKSGEKAADNGSTWAMVYLGALLIIGAVVLHGIVPLYHSTYTVFLEPASYIATLIVGSALIFLAGILRLLNEISLRKEAQAQTKAYYEQLDKARASRQMGEAGDLAAIDKAREDGKRDLLHPAV
jgi:hypothetical protein